MREVALTRGYVAIVDDADYALVAQFRWFARPAKHTVYASRTAWSQGVTTQIQMHRLILGVPSGVLVDHADGNGLNNSRSNLRLATTAANNANRRPREDRGKTVPGVKGVKFDVRRNRFCARIQFQGQQIFLGSFESVQEAAIAYNAAALRLYRSFARLNEVSTHEVPAEARA